MTLINAMIFHSSRGSSTRRNRVVVDGRHVVYNMPRWALHEIPMWIGDPSINIRAVKKRERVSGSGEHYSTGIRHLLATGRYP